MKDLYSHIIAAALVTIALVGLSKLNDAEAEIATVRAEASAEIATLRAALNTQKNEHDQNLNGLSILVTSMESNMVKASQFDQELSIAIGRVKEQLNEQENQVKHFSSTVSSVRPAIEGLEEQLGVVSQMSQEVKLTIEKDLSYLMQLLEPVRSITREPSGAVFID